MQRMLDKCLTPAAPKSTCQTSRAKWWKPTHVGGQEGTRSLLWVNLQLSCKRMRKQQVSLRAQQQAWPTR